MNTTHTPNLPNLPVPAGATADDWCDLTDIEGDVARSLTWSRHDTDRVGVAVDGWQYADGRIDRSVSLYQRDTELTAADARALARALIAALDVLDDLS